MEQQKQEQIQMQMQPVAKQITNRLGPITSNVQLANRNLIMLYKTTTTISIQIQIPIPIPIRYLFALSIF